MKRLTTDYERCTEDAQYILKAAKATVIFITAILAVCTFSVLKAHESLTLKDIALLSVTYLVSAQTYRIVHKEAKSAKLVLSRKNSETIKNLL